MNQGEARNEVPGRVSVIVPTRNNARTIAACLDSIRGQDHPDLEIIVVDNHSSDGTGELAASRSDILVTAGPERSAQRNRGVAESSGEWILWLDSDMILNSDAIRLAVETAATQDATGVALPERTIGSGFWTACRALERECYLNAPWLHNPRLLRREYMLGEGAFHENMSGPEDTDLRFKMRAEGRTIALAPIIIDHDEGHLTLREILEKRYYYGRSIPALAAEHGTAVSTQRREVLRAYRINWKRLAKRPVHALGMVFMRTLEAVGYLVGARRGRRDHMAESASS